MSLTVDHIDILSEHFEIIECESGSEALHALELEPPDAIVVDFDLPDMDGSALAETVRRDWAAQIPIVMFSGDANHIELCSNETLPPSDMPCRKQSLLELLTSITH